MSLLLQGEMEVEVAVVRVLLRGRLSDPGRLIPPSSLGSRVMLNLTLHHLLNPTPHTQTHIHAVHSVNAAVSPVQRRRKTRFYTHPARPHFHPDDPSPLTYGSNKP